jgi:outer membrane protein assembly factor BamB
MFTDDPQTKRTFIPGYCAWALAICLLAGGCLNRVPETRTSPAFARSNSVIVDQASAGLQWSGWRGANLHGVSACENLPTKWNRGEGIRWRVDVPGQGNSSPVVWDDHVYLTSHVTADEVDELVALCFDRSSGQRLWDANLGTARGPTHQKNGYASATLATNGEHIVAFVGSRRLYCLDRSGAELWRVEFPMMRHQWGLAASPLIFRNLVIQLCDGQPQSFLVALDLDTGREVWRTARESQGTWSTPVTCPVSTGGAIHFELIVNGTSRGDGSAGSVTAYDPHSGEPLWQTPCTTDIPCPTLIVGDGVVVSTSGGNGPVVAIRLGGHGDISDSHVVWSHSSGGPYVPTGVAYQNRLFTVSDSGRMTCFNLADGRTIWKQRLAGTFTASLVAGDGNIYATNERGEIYVVPASDRFELVAANPLEERCLATPAIAHGLIFVRTEKSLFCIEGSESSSSDDLADTDKTEDDVLRSMSDRDSVAKPEPTGEAR